MSTEPVDEPEVLPVEGQHPDDVEPDEPLDDSLEPLGGDPEDLDDAEVSETLNGGGASDPGDDPVLDEDPDEDETGDGHVYHDTTGGGL